MDNADTFRIPKIYFLYTNYYSDINLIHKYHIIYLEIALSSYEMSALNDVYFQNVDKLFQIYYY